MGRRVHRLEAEGGVLNLPSSVRIYLATEPTDMRKGFDGLAALVSGLSCDVYSGHLYVFVSRRGDRIKILSWDRGGFVLWYKRLERGRFKLPPLKVRTPHHREHSFHRIVNTITRHGEHCCAHREHRYTAS